MVPSAFRRFLSAVISATVLLGALLAPLGCQRTVPPVEQTDWRSHLRSPSRLRRNWVLPDNTMLAEIARPPGWPVENVPLFSYEVYDPRTDTSTTIVPGSHAACLRTISDRKVEFVAGNFTGIRYLLSYDMVTRQLAELPAQYAAAEPRRFGLSNRGGWYGITVTAAGIMFHESVYFVTRPNVAGGELLMEFPGAVTDSRIPAPFVVETLPPLVSDAVLTDGVTGKDGATLPGMTLHLKLRSPDWSRLTYGLIGPPSVRKQRVVLTLSEQEQPNDLALSFAAPSEWDDWQRWATLHSSPVTKSWPLSDDVLFVQWTDSPDRGSGIAYGLCDLRERTIAILVGLSEGAVPLSITPERIELLADMSGVCAYASWPYRIVMDPLTGISEESPVRISVTQAIGFGGSSSVLRSVVAENGGLRPRFTDLCPETDCGDGAWITTKPDPNAHQLLIRFHNPVSKPDYAAEKGLTLGPLDVTGVPFVIAAALEKGIVGADGKTGPGVTLRLTLDAAAWDRLTYGFEAAVLWFSDREPATDVSGLADRVRPWPPGCQPE
jgi:hypothetical protein